MRKGHRTAHRGQNPCSSARAYAALEAAHRDASTCACVAECASEAASPSTDRADGRASCSRANPHVATSRGCVDSRTEDADVRCHGCASSMPTDPSPRYACTKPLERALRADTNESRRSETAPVSSGRARAVVSASELFRTTSARMCLSSVRSATRRLSRVFTLRQMSDLDVEPCHLVQARRSCLGCKLCRFLPAHDTLMLSSSPAADG